MCSPICYVDLVWSQNGSTVFNSNPVTHFLKSTIGRVISWPALILLGYCFVKLTVAVDVES
jgi:hypothetical protein